jgi:hypothetical protein
LELGANQGATEILKRKNDVHLRQLAEKSTYVRTSFFFTKQSSFFYHVFARSQQAAREFQKRHLKQMGKIHVENFLQKIKLKGESLC